MSNSNTFIIDANIVSIQDNKFIVRCDPLDVDKIPYSKFKNVSYIPIQRQKYGVIHITIHYGRIKKLSTMMGTTPQEWLNELIDKKITLKISWKKHKPKIKNKLSNNYILFYCDSFSECTYGTPNV